MFLNRYTGKGVRIAVIDSGVHAAHPHVGGVAGGMGVRDDGMLVDDYVDRLGHGTAVTAAIREKAPDAEILIIKVFWQMLATDIGALIRGIEEAATRQAAVINLSLGTAEMEHRDRLAATIAAVRRAGSMVVAAHDDGATRWLPGILADVVAVRADWSVDRSNYTVSSTIDGRPLLLTSPYPRDIPGVPRERNVSGVSFAVANASGFVARALEAAPGADVAGLFATLHEGACIACN
jgi:subtilisin family serine protease